MIDFESSFFWRVFIQSISGSRCDLKLIYQVLGIYQNCRPSLSFMWCLIGTGMVVLVPEITLWRLFEGCMLMGCNLVFRGFLVEVGTYIICVWLSPLVGFWLDGMVLTNQDQLFSYDDHVLVNYWCWYLFLRVWVLIACQLCQFCWFCLWIYQEMNDLHFY